MIKILIADDHPIVRQGLKQILAEEPDMKVLGEASNGREVLGRIRKELYDVVLLDISMPGRDALEILKELKYLRPKLPVLILSTHSEDQFGPRVLKAGAAGYMTKESAPEVLVSGIRKVYRGGKYISPYLAEQLAVYLQADSEQPPHKILSDREYEVFRLLASGNTVTEIAKELCLSVRSISTYRARILEKMKLRTNAQLTHYAIKNSLVD